MYADPTDLEAPLWPGRAGRRLRVGQALSAACIATLLLVLQFPVARQAQPMAELLVHIIVEEVESVVEPMADDRQVDEPAEMPRESHGPRAADPAAGPGPASIDWYAQIPAAATAY